MEEFISKGYLYTEWGGKLTVKEGTVIRNQLCYQDEAIFIFGPSDREHVRCHVKPKKIINAKFWLPKRDDKLGKKLLIEYHEDVIDRTMRSVASHEAKIRRLKNA